MGGNSVREPKGIGEVAHAGTLQAAMAKVGPRSEKDPVFQKPGEEAALEKEVFAEKAYKSNGQLEQRKG